MFKNATSPILVGTDLGLAIRMALGLGLYREFPNWKVVHSSRKLDYEFGGFCTFLMQVQLSRLAVL